MIANVISHEVVSAMMMFYRNSRPIARSRDDDIELFYAVLHDYYREIP